MKRLVKAIPLSRIALFMICYSSFCLLSLLCIIYVDRTVSCLTRQCSYNPPRVRSSLIASDLYPSIGPQSPGAEWVCRMPSLGFVEGLLLWHKRFGFTHFNCTVVSRLALRFNMSMTTEDCTKIRPGFPRPIPETPHNVLEQFQMRGKVVIITGAADGIGLAVAEAMAEAGANVALWYNS